MVETVLVARRINAPITDELYEQLLGDSNDAGVTMSDQMRALLEFWSTDEDLRDRARERAKVIRTETKRQQYQRKK